MRFASLKRKWLLLILLLAMLIPVSFAVVKFLQWTYVDRYREEWSNFVAEDPSLGNSTLTVRGVITDVALNRKTSGFSTYHTFPALITLNLTEVVWVGNGVWDEGNRTVISVGYDFAETSDIMVSGSYEVSGFWFSVADSAYSNKLVVAPSIKGSYIRPL